jgi:hypothetical protein
VGDSWGLGVLEEQQGLGEPVVEGRGSTADRVERGESLGVRRGLRRRFGWFHG